MPNRLHAIWIDTYVLLLKWYYVYFWWFYNTKAYLFGGKIIVLCEELLASVSHVIRVCMMAMNMDVSNMRSNLLMKSYLLVHYWLSTTIKGSCLHNIACQIFGKILKYMDQQVHGIQIYLSIVYTHQIGHDVGLRESDVISVSPTQLLYLFLVTL